MRSAEDIREVRRFLDAQGAEIPLVAKLERHEVLGNLPAVVDVVDAVMVARGDLGVDVPLEDVPHIQKEIIRQAHAAKVPVIVATQMLESMVTHLRPTRAEVSDVSTAIFDGADAIMLSAESATGRHPVEAVEVDVLRVDAGQGVEHAAVGGADGREDVAVQGARQHGAVAEIDADDGHRPDAFPGRLEVGVDEVRDTVPGEQHGSR